MNRMWHYLSGFLVLGGLLLAGCGGYDEGTVTVSGTLTNGGQPLTGSGTPNTTDYKGYQIIFMQEKEGKWETYAYAFVDGSGKYSVELLPGKYKVAVGHSAGAPLPMAKAPGSNLDLSKFIGSKTPIELTVEGSTTFDIDISKF